MSEQRLLMLHALTGMHPGSGTALGVVDLPVQRERHTQWPTIPGSSLKGVLRAATRPSVLDGDAKSQWEAAFGPDTKNASDHAGALSLTDARLFAFPVRSLRGIFAWVTCPEAIYRLNCDLRLCGISGIDSDLSLLQDRSKGDPALLPADSLLLVGEQKDRLVLEEFEFVRRGDAPAIRDWAAAHFGAADQSLAERITSRLVVLSDDDFTHFVRHATEVVARIGLNYETKTVASGALFYEEYLPAECLFYSVALAEDSYKKDWKRSASDMLSYVADALLRQPVLQIGGNSTIGKGLCQAHLLSQEVRRS
ncbi:MAG: hypothetical protein GEEBNDBF_02720 [bacterium]|nr:hypothetical protein [bacterium]